MQKVVIHRAGSHDQLKLEDHPTPVAGRGEVLVRCKAIGVNYADCVVRMGLYASAKEYVGWPITPGFEFAGEVEGTGEGIDDLDIGTEVMGLTRFGAYSSHIVVPRRNLVRKPDFMSMEEASALPVVGLTAWYALFELVRLRPGMKILVHSAAGGVGGTLVQLAKIADCFVVGVVGSSHKVEMVQSLGADVVIDKSRESLWQEAERHAGDGYHVVLDANGVETLRESYEHLCPEGKLICYGFHTMLPRTGGKPRYLNLAWNWFRTPRFDPLDLTTRNRSVMGFNLSFLFSRAELLLSGLDQLLAWREEGLLKKPEIQTFPLARVGEAHQALESAQTVGKLVLIP